MSLPLFYVTDLDTKIGFCGNKSAKKIGQHLVHSHISYSIILILYYILYISQHSFFSFVVVCYGPNTQTYINTDFSV